MSSFGVVVMHETRRFHNCTTYVGVCRTVRVSQTGVRPRPSQPDFELLGTLGNLLMASVKRARGAVASTVVWSLWVQAKLRLFVCMCSEDVRRQTAVDFPADARNCCNIWSRDFCFCRYWGSLRFRLRRLRTNVLTLQNDRRLLWQCTHFPNGGISMQRYHLAMPNREFAGVVISDLLATSLPVLSEGRSAPTASPACLALLQHPLACSLLFAYPITSFMKVQKFSGVTAPTLSALPWATLLRSPTASGPFATTATLHP